MVEVTKCPRCKSTIEVGEFKNEEEDKIAVFCSNEKCLFHKNPLAGIDRKKSELWVSETLI